MWSPNPTLTIGGVDYTAQALETIRVTRGRTEVYDEPRPGYLIAELVDLTGAGFPITPFDTVSLTLDDSTGTPSTIYRGRVSDTARALYDTGVESGSAGTVLTVIAVGALARMSRRQVFTAGLPAEKEGNRIAALVAAGIATTWEEAGGTWAQQGTATWADFDQDFDPNRIDQPGLFDLEARPAQPDGYNALGESYLSALSGLGILWDDREGFIAYADADRRVTTDQNDDYLNLDRPEIGAAQLATQSQGGDITTRVAVNHAGGTVIIQDAGAVLKFGRLERTFDTTLLNESNAEQWAEQYLRGHSGPIVKLQDVTVRLDLTDDDQLRDDLLTIDVNAGVRLLNVPGTLGLSFRRTFVEGLTWRIDRQRIALSLSLSDAALSVGFQRWSSVNPALAWQDVDATLTWQDATVVTA